MWICLQSDFINGFTPVKWCLAELWGLSTRKFLCFKHLNKCITVDFIRHNCLNSFFSSCKTRKENLILRAVMYNFDRKKFCGKSELPQVFWFSIWLLVTTAGLIKADLSPWSYLYFITAEAKWEVKAGRRRGCCVQAW